MRRSGHPSRPRAITCCFFASLKTLLISTKAICLTPKSTSRASFSLAGFQVTIIGRFWVTAGVAVSIYVLVAIVRKRLGLAASLYQTLQILSVTLFEKTPILCALQASDAEAEFTKNVNQLILFDI